MTIYKNYIKEVYAYYLLEFELYTGRCIISILPRMTNQKVHTW